LRFIEDVSRGVSPEKAGWCFQKRDELERELIGKGLIERDDENVRVAPNGLRSSLRIDNEGGALQGICLDIFKAVGVSERIEGMIKSQDPDVLAGITTLGWWRMLKASEFPVMPDRVLKEGVSLVDWYAEAPKGAFELACSVAAKRFELNYQVSLQGIAELSPPTPEGTSMLSKIKNILDWRTVLEILPENLVDALSYVWVGDHLSSRECLHYPEAITYLQSKIWDQINLTTGKQEAEIVEQIDSVNEALGKVIPSIEWSGIIFLPW